MRKTSLDFAKLILSYAAFLCALINFGYADVDCGLGPVAIMGGHGDSSGSSHPAYAAFVNPIGNVIPLALNISNGTISGAAMNGQSQAIIGGLNHVSAYAALVDSIGNVTPLDLHIPAGAISTVAINGSAQAIIGGEGSSMGVLPSYAALVDPRGQVTPLALDIPNGAIESAAINDSARAIIGGFGDSMGNDAPAYAALVDPMGNVTSLALNISSGLIHHVAINDSAQAIIGGLGDSMGSPSPAYAALIDPMGTVMPLSLDIPDGEIYSVAINDSAQAIIGGFGDSMGNPSPAYAALIDSSGNVLPLDLNISNGLIWNVAINSQSQAIIGGTINGMGSAIGYAALVDSSGNVLPLNLNISTSDFAGGGILDVAINSFGQAMVGGQGDTMNGTSAYSALIDSTGNVYPFNLNIPNGVIGPVSIPDYIPMTNLKGNNRIFACYIDKYAPQDIFYFAPAFYHGNLSRGLENAAPTRNALSIFAADNNLFYLNHGLSQHLRNRRYLKGRSFLTRTAAAQATKTASSQFIASSELIASESGSMIESTPAPVNSEPIVSEPSSALESNSIQASPEEIPRLDNQSTDVPEPIETPTCEEQAIAHPCPMQERPYTLWFEGIGAFASQKPQHETFGFEPATGGFIFAFDKIATDNSLIGGGMAYTYTHIWEKKEAGHSDINQEYLFLYATWSDFGLYVDGALWMAIFQTHQVRKINLDPFFFTSTSKPSGFQLSPHFEIGYDKMKWNRCEKSEFIIDPFAMVDWVNAWQGRYQEKGSGPFNVVQRAQYSSFLRTEAGLRFYETFSFDSWRLVLEEKGSYVNKTPFKVGRVSAFLVGSPGSFTVETLSSSQNLGVAEMSFIFEPNNQAYPYGSITYQGEFGSGFQSHQGMAEVSWNF